MDKAQRKHIRELQRFVENFLYEEWDPIGINDSAPRDEYDSYAPHLCLMLMDGKPKEKLAEHLDQCLMVNMGLRKAREHSERTAEKLLEAYSEWQIQQKLRSKRTLGPMDD